MEASDKIEFKQHYKVENERLQAENEKLKKDIRNIYENCKYCDKFYMDKCNYTKKENKYKQALEEIRKSVDVWYNTGDERHYEIITIINEVLND